MLLAEDLLLVTDDASGRLSAPAAQVDAGLGGANLVELTLRNKVDLSGEQDPGKPGRLVVRDPSTTGDAILDAALEIVLAYQAQEAICGALGAEQEPAADAVRAAGRQRGGSRRAEQDPGCRPVHRWPAQDASHEAEVRRLVTQALVHQVAPDTRIAALIALLRGLECEDKIVDPGSTACPSGNSGHGRRRSPRASGHHRPSARRSRR